MAKSFMFVVYVCLAGWVWASESELICSKFPYEQQLLEKMIRTEIKVENMVKEIKETQDQVRTVLSNIETKMESLAKDYTKLEENVTSVLVDVKAKLDLYQETTKAELTRFKSDVESEIDKKTLEIDAFKNNSKNELQAYKELLKVEIDADMMEGDEYKNEIRDEVNSLMENITAEVQKEIAELDLLEVKLGNPVVAFNVHGPADLSIGTNEVFQFSDVLLNKGGRFNSSDGKFTAPMTGLYYFSAHVCAVAGKFVHYGIVVGNTLLTSSSQREDTDSSCGSVSVVATVSEKQEVFVKCLSGNGYDSQLLENDFRWNSFVGALIQ